jgi:hypothetical protein
MTLGKITGTKTFEQAPGEKEEFTGMDITAEFLNENGRTSFLSFHYAHYTNDLRGRVESVLHTILKNKPAPKNVSDVVVSGKA